MCYATIIHCSYSEGIKHLSRLQIGLEGTGFEPTVDALFGENGFFPDIAMKTMYFVSDNLPLRVEEILQNVLPGLKQNRMKRQVFCFVKKYKKL